MIGNSLYALDNFNNLRSSIHLFGSDRTYVDLPVNYTFELPYDLILFSQLRTNEAVNKHIVGIDYIITIILP
jgi:hypothetical protein